jgi:hypothetical protein
MSIYIKALVVVRLPLRLGDRSLTLAIDMERLRGHVAHRGEASADAAPGHFRIGIRTQGELMKSYRLSLAALAVMLAAPALAQLPFPPNWPNAPVGVAKQAVYPYPGQCWTAAAIAGLPQCQITNAAAPGYAPSFLCEPSGASNQSAFSSNCGAVVPARIVNPVDPATQAKFQWEVLNPLDYTPDTTTYPGVEYYEIGLHEAQGFQAIADAGLFRSEERV